MKETSPHFWDTMELEKQPQCSCLLVRVDVFISGVARIIFWEEIRK